MVFDWYFKILSRDLEQADSVRLRMPVLTDL